MRSHSRNIVSHFVCCRETASTTGAPSCLNPQNKVTLVCDSPSLPLSLPRPLSIYKLMMYILMNIRVKDPADFLLTVLIGFGFAKIFKYIVVAGGLPTLRH